MSYAICWTKYFICNYLVICYHSSYNYVGRKLFYLGVLGTELRASHMLGLTPTSSILFDCRISVYSPDDKHTAASQGEHWGYRPCWKRFAQKRPGVLAEAGGLLSDIGYHTDFTSWWCLCTQLNLAELGFHILRGVNKGHCCWGPPLGKPSWTHFWFSQQQHEVGILCPFYRWEH
jgi:hypothetical protein